jgi:hypothetical protein
MLKNMFNSQNNPKTVYEELAIKKNSYQNLRYIATAILASAVEDADVEFFTDDYNKWKTLRLKRNKKNSNFSEFDLKSEFKNKEMLKETLFDICEIQLKASDIPDDVLKQRELFENNTMDSLLKNTAYKHNTLMNIAELHNWKIGINYQEPTIFDL